MKEELENRRTTRPRFLKQLGATLMVGLGAGALASAARADHTTGHCCPATNPSSQCTRPGDPQSCTGGQTLFHCNCSGVGQNYCICKSQTTCYNGPC
jgi:hypothetical protein